MGKMIHIGSSAIGSGHTYIIAEVGSNFDGNLNRAKRLADLAKELGADAYKIQNFLAPKIVSAVGFANLQIAFQASWDKPVVEVYQQAEFPRAWLQEVSDHCGSIGIDFFSSPYDVAAVDLLEQIKVPAYKIGSGEIDNVPFLQYVAKTGKPIIMGVGASTMSEVEDAVSAVRKAGNDNIILLQCVTGYPSPIADANVRAMLTLKEKFGVLVGYSDHTIGPAQKGDDPLDGLTVPLASVALGAVVIEKHFTDDPLRKGPDHAFAMGPDAFRKMVNGIRAIEKSLGDGIKDLAPSEKETSVIQRRGIYAAKLIQKGERIERTHLELLRPAVGLRPAELDSVIGKKAQRNIPAGAPLQHDDVNWQT